MKTLRCFVAFSQPHLHWTRGRPIQFFLVGFFFFLSLSQGEISLILDGIKCSASVLPPIFWRTRARHSVEIVHLVAYLDFRPRQRLVSCWTGEIQHHHLWSISVCVFWNVLMWKKKKVQCTTMIHTRIISKVDLISLSLSFFFFFAWRADRSGYRAASLQLPTQPVNSWCKLGRRKERRSERCCWELWIIQPSPLNSDNTGKQTPSSVRVSRATKISSYWSKSLLHVT